MIEKVDQMSPCIRCVQSTSMTMPQLAFLYEMDADWFGRSVPKTPLSPFPRVCCSWTGIKFSDYLWLDMVWIRSVSFRLLKIYDNLGVSTCFRPRIFPTNPPPKSCLTWAALHVVSLLKALLTSRKKRVCCEDLEHHPQWKKAFMKPTGE